jgi:molybdate transport system ATP-binding protein
MNMTISVGSHKIIYPQLSFELGMNLVLGPSGVGKTTLLRWMHGELAGSEKFYSNEGTSLMSQESKWIDYLTIQEHLNLFEAGVDLPMIDRLGLIEHLHKLPRQLSVGQLQRFAFVWTLQESRKIVLLDEPTSALDDDWAEEIIMILKERIEQSQDLMILAVTHDIRLKNAFKYSNTIAL